MAQVLMALVRAAFTDDTPEVIQHLQANPELATKMGDRLGFALRGTGGQCPHVRREFT